MVPGGIGDVAPWPDWSAAARGALEFLHEHVGWDLWMVTRVVDDCQYVLCSYPDGAVRPGARIWWEESFCRQMIEGRAPRVATVTAAIPAYAALTKGLGRDVAAYIGVPLVTADGQLFGTLCGVAFRAKPLSAARDLRLVETIARMLSTLLAAGVEPPTPPDLP
ncbi:GAF domain-containing protein [Blastococcus sp. CT_GayMR16]|uniref:GAF domain-containing protein n=1 Tax=Blastococcus sp. CT_GayMR16 TaxID=2559607 RepID=UPI001073C9C3|nr:GAF domain-containing protein [Blastococcus sp. CT_GayMR16]TFV87922.1 GAF domain-containing protein [Blastococcus sp. CT_GayMR16]